MIIEPEDSEHCVPYSEEVRTNLPKRHLDITNIEEITEEELQQTDETLKDDEQEQLI